MKGNIFNSIRVKKTPKNNFDLSHDVKMSLKMGNLYPCMMMDVVPGDNVKISGEALVRLAPMIAPMMHRVDVSIHYFFVPNRILWENWEKFISPDFVRNPVLPAHPYINLDDVSDWDQFKLFDYMGIPRPIVSGNAEQINALPFAAYQKIYDEYYRDQNLIDPVWKMLNDGNNTPDMAELCQLRRRAWEHDYFTSCLPWAQKGPAVKMPVSGDVVLKSDWADLDGNPKFVKQDGSSIVGPVTSEINAEGGYIDINADGEAHAFDPNGTLEVTNITSTINDFRRATKLQEWLELAARAGSRYKEGIYAFFGVNSPDKRLQRPEYITGVKSPISISEVVNTTGVQGERPQGDMAGHGLAMVNGNTKGYFVEEHGWIIGIMSVMPKTAYQQGIHKSFLRSDIFEYYFPQFANIGEQEVKNRELYAFNGTAYSEQTFGYVPRYAEYKFMNNRVAGDFRSTLAFWHMGRIFGAPPALNKEFIECAPRKDVFAVPDEDVDEVWCHVYNKVYASRSMPVFGTPTI